MEEAFKKYLDYHIKLSPDITAEQIRFLGANTSVKEQEKKDFFLKKDEIQKEMGFVVKGLLRRYYINDKGKKITTYFLKENDFATDYPSFIKLNILLNVQNPV